MSQYSPWWWILAFHLVMFVEAVIYIRRFPAGWRKVGVEFASAFLLGFVIALWLWTLKLEFTSWTFAFVGGLLQIWFSKRRLKTPSQSTQDSPRMDQN